MQRPSNLVEKFVVSEDGTRVFAGAIGNPEKPALVFVHGIMTSSSVFNDIFSCPENSNDFYLVRFDMRGHGRTGKPITVEGYSSKKHAEDFAAVVKEFNAKSLIIVGWSWGGTIIGDVTSYLPPGTIRGAVYIASHPTMGQTAPTIASPSLLPIWAQVTSDEALISDLPIAFVRLCFARNEQPSPGFFEETLKLNSEGHDFVSDNPAATNEIRLAALGMMTTMNATHRRLALMHTNDEKIYDLLASDFPVLAVVGTRDNFFDYKTLLESLQKLVKNLDTHLVEGASHTTFVDAPEEVMKAVLGFARKIVS